MQVSMLHKETHSSPAEKDIIELPRQPCYAFLHQGLQLLQQLSLLKSVGGQCSGSTDTHIAPAEEDIIKILPLQVCYGFQRNDRNRQ